MAGVKISALPAVTNPTITDVFPLVQAGVTYKSTISQILDLTTGPASEKLATTGALTATYNNGASGVGATLINSGALAALTIDGISAALADRVLVKDQAAPAQNGIYTVTTVGDGATAWVLTRAADYNTVSQIQPGDFFTVWAGTLNANTQWIQQSIVTTIGTDAITFQSNIVAGTGVTKIQNVITVTGAGIGWTVVTGTTQAAAVNNGYFANNAGTVTVTLPATASIGATVRVAGMGAGGWAVAQNAGQSIKIGNTVTTVGVGGSLASTDIGDAVEIVCRVANTGWQVLSLVGNITVV
jgi:hypothetical protein